MDTLFSISKNILSHTDMRFKRYLHEKINWNNRLIGIMGARGVGKTTLMLQHLNELTTDELSIYVSAEHLYFSANSILDFAGDFIKIGGKVLCIDEIHQYPDWAREIKVIYDSYPQLKIVFSGSSILDITHGSTDLSRRVITYQLHGLSFREYMNFAHEMSIPTITLDDYLNNRLPNVQTPLRYFADYLREGYYPFFKEDDYPIRLHNVINKVIDIDLVKHLGLKSHTGQKLKRLLSIVAGNVPFKPNLANISEVTEISTRLLPEYFGYMERSGLIRMLNTHGKSLRVLAKADKLYLNNSNLSFAISNNPDTGSVRETYFASQLSILGQIELPPNKADFYFSGYTFEVGGMKKGRKQILNEKDAYLIKDNIEIGVGNTLPLWAVGLIY